MDKINSETAFFKIDGVEFEVKKVEVKARTCRVEMNVFIEHICNNPGKYSFQRTCNLHGFYSAMKIHGLQNDWEQFLVTEARKRGFVSGCHFSDGMKITYMPSGRMKLLTLSKLVTDCRNPTVIYDNGKWCNVIKKETKPDIDEETRNKCRELIAKITYCINNNNINFIALDKEQGEFVRDILNSEL